ncbi:MAG: LamG-like jellyroll fold domain-containing protein [Bacteroidota bacterium]
MKKQVVLFGSLILALALLILVESCKKKSDTVTFTMSALVAQLLGGNIDMNGATSPNNVPANPTIVATFSSPVNSASVTANAVTLVRDYDTKNIELTFTVSGNSITIVPKTSLGNGALFSLNLSSITSTDGQSMAAVKRTFTTIGTFVPDGMVAYYSFENTASDVLNRFNPMVGGVIDLTYATSYSTAAGMAAKFNGTSTLIRIPKGDSLMLTNDFTLAFWIFADTTSRKGQFTMGVAGWYGFQFEIFGAYDGCKLAAQYAFEDGTSGSEDLFFAGDGLTKDNGGWKGWTFCKDLKTSGGVKFLLGSKWAYVTCRYKSDTKLGTMYINGEKMKEQDYNLYDPPKTTVTGIKYNGAVGNNTFVFGFIQDKNNPTIADDWAKYENPANNHFKGLLDNVRIFHKALTEKEIQMMYDSEKL